MSDLPDPWSFEMAGGWALCGSGQLAPDRLAKLLVNLDEFRAHIPRVIASIYPPS